MKLASILPAIFMLTLAGAADAKGKKGRKKGKKTKNCPKDPQEAAAIALKWWAEVWEHTVMINDGPAECDPGKIKDFLTQYFTDDMTLLAEGPTFSPLYSDDDLFLFCAGNQEPLYSDTEEYPYPSLFGAVDTCLNTIGDALAGNCAQKNFLSFGIMGADIDPEDCTKFTVKVNEFVTFPTNCPESQMPITTGRTYSYQMGKKNELPKMYLMRFNCPYEIGNTLAGCTTGATKDPGYTIIDERPGPNERGCIAGVAPGTCTDSASPPFCVCPGAPECDF